MANVTVYCVNAFLLSIALILGMTKVAYRVGLVDVPSSMKSHGGQIPMVGAAMFAAFCVASILLQRPPAGLVDLFIGLLFIVALGIIDDLLDLRASLKLVAQGVCVAAMVVPNGLLIRNIGVIFPGNPLLLSQWAVPVTIFAVVGLVNGINMIDGLDGLAGGTCLVALAWFGIAAAILGLSEDLSLILVLAFVVLGFLVFNFRHPWRARASVFLGDAGSMMLGLSLAFVAITLSQRIGNSLSPIAILWIFAVPTIDTLSLMVRRVASGQGLLSSDRHHLHDLLRAAGLSVNAVVLAIVAISTALGGVGIAGWYLGVPDSLMLIGLGGPVLLHTWFVSFSHKRPPPSLVSASGQGDIAAPFSDRHRRALTALRR